MVVSEVEGVVGGVLDLVGHHGHAGAVQGVRIGCSAVVSDEGCVDKSHVSPCDLFD